MMMRQLAFALLSSSLVLTACAPPTAGPGAGDAGGPKVEVSPPGRTLVAAVRLEPLTIAARPLREQGIAVYLSGRMFNAQVAMLDASGLPIPYLVESLPALNTGSWQVFADGRMETTYRLKPGLTWQDGIALAADDFVFSWRVYSDPRLSVGEPFRSIDEVVAPDERTLVVRWNRPYPDADSFSDRNAEFPPLPRHLLDQPFRELDADALINHPYWTAGYVGLGPYKLDLWEPGTYIQASAFQGHVSGRARIDRIRLVFISDSNATLASLMAGDIHLSADSSLRASQAPMLRQEWGPGGGSVLLHPNQWRAAYFQFRRDIVKPRALLNPVLRQAMAHTVQREAINDAVYGGDSIVADFMIAPGSEFGPMAADAIARYPYDLQRSAQLMAAADYRIGPDGSYAGVEGKLGIELQTNAAADNESELSILGDHWRRVGFDVHESILSAAQARDNQARANFSGLFVNNTTIGTPALLNQTSPRIPSEANHWQGGNRGGWSDPDFDRLAASFTTELGRAERGRLVEEMARTYTLNEPAISLFFRTQPWAFMSALKGVSLVAPEANMSWNMHEWEFR